MLQDLLGVANAQLVVSLAKVVVLFDRADRGQGIDDLILLFKVEKSMFTEQRSVSKRWIFAQ